MQDALPEDRWAVRLPVGRRGIGPAKRTRTAAQDVLDGGATVGETQAATPSATRQWGEAGGDAWDDAGGRDGRPPQRLGDRRATLPTAAGPGTAPPVTVLPGGHRQVVPVENVTVNGVA